jgi:mannose-6-phosphate isomerase-like protein (cupin superfamily)
LSDATEIDVHRLQARILMDAGELGSRNMSVNWLEVPAGASEDLRSHEEAEQVYVVVRGTGTITATGESQQVTEGDLAMIAPATDHTIANDGPDPFALVCVQSPGVSADELYSRRLAVQAAGYDGEYDDE